MRGDIVGLSDINQLAATPLHWVAALAGSSRLSRKIAPGLPEKSRQSLIVFSVHTKASKVYLDRALLL